MSHYSTNDLILMITTNNLQGVYARLLQDGLVSGTMSPSVDAISYTVQEQARRLRPAEFLAWLERAFDVPADVNRPYASELRALALETGQTPARRMVELFRESLEADGVAASADDRSTGLVPASADYGVPVWLGWMVMLLAVVGLFSLVQALVRRFND